MTDLFSIVPGNVSVDRSRNVPDAAFLAPVAGPVGSRGVLLEYGIPTAARVRLRIIDPAGRSVTTLVDARQEKGLHEARWNGTGRGGMSVSSGVYLAVLDVEGVVRSRKVVFVR